MTSNKNSISVIMPTFNQGAFIARAIKSLLVQKHLSWELIIIDDGSADYTEDIVVDYLQDNPIRYFKNERNKGLGYCLNRGMQMAIHNYIAYLPSDDIYYSNHLSLLYDSLLKTQDAILCYSGLRHQNADSYSSGLSVKMSLGIIPQVGLQLVQVMHKKTTTKWVERDVFVTGDLDKMFWNSLQQDGNFVGTNTITCEWVNHPNQRHKIFDEKYGGGLQTYKNYYGVKDPLKFYDIDGKYIDEAAESAPIKNTRVEPGKLKILIVGELGFNPERLLAFEQHGHQLFSLWITNPDIHNSIGPFDFGNIIDLNIDNLQEQIEEIKPDIIYALLNTQAVMLAHYVMLANPDIPFVWHFKEGPFFCRNFGIWKELFELYYNADGRIYINQQSKEWYEQFIGDMKRPSFVLDGDLPPAEWFTDETSSLLSDSDGAIHTLMAGRPYGITPADIATLTKHNVHIHLYGEFYQSKWSRWIDNVLNSAPGHLHLHPHCKPENWAKEFSKYDAGWLHCFESTNNGELMQCSWDDLNYPARISTLAVAGLPMIQKNNEGHMVASQKLIEALKVGVLFNSYEELGKQLNDKAKMKIKRGNLLANRVRFSFDHYVTGLIDFFTEVIKLKQA